MVILSGMLFDVAESCHHVCGYVDFMLSSPETFPAYMNMCTANNNINMSSDMINE